MIKCFKLVSGEEIVCEVTATETQFYTVTNPALITMMMPENAGESVRIGILPICVQAEGATIKIYKDKIVYFYIPQSRFADQYSEIMNPSPIVKAPSGLISPRGEILKSNSPERELPRNDISAIMIENPNSEVDLDFSENFDDEKGE